MRLLISGIAIIIFFAFGVWAIALLLAPSPDWLKIALAMLWLFSLCYWGILFENHRLRKGNDQRLLLLSGVLTAALMAAFLVPVLVLKVDIPRWAAEAVMAAIAVVVFISFKRIPVHRTPAEMIAFLEQVRESGVASSSWKNFVNTKIAEPGLEAVRLKLLHLNTDSVEAFDQVLESLIAELREGQAELAQR